jgi:hypothetical protein
MKITIDGKTFDTDNPEAVALVNAALRDAFAEQERRLRDAYKLAYDQAYGALLTGKFEGARWKHQTIGPTPEHPNGQSFRVIEIYEPEDL